MRVIARCLPALVLLAAAIPASAETVLRFSPQDTMVNINDTASLSVFVDEPLELRTFEAFVHYDDDILTSVNGVHGQLFTDTGAYIFESWEETSPGYWHGYAIVMDALSWVVGPGELYVWTFTADQGGFHSDVQAILCSHRLHQAFGFGRHFRPNAVTRQKDNLNTHIRSSHSVIIGSACCRKSNLSRPRNRQ